MIRRILGTKIILETDYFIMSVKTDNTGTSNNDQFTIPVNLGTYDIITSEHSLTGQTGSTTITFAAAGTYDVKIYSDSMDIYFNNGGDRLKLLDVKQWGSISWKSSMLAAFRGCANLATLTATDKPDLSSVTNFSNFFRDCTLFNTDIGDWDVSNITNMDVAFRDCPAFNQDLSSWNTSNTTNMTALFSGNTNLDQDFSAWDINQVTNLLSFMLGVTLSTANYDALLIAWDAQGTMSYSGTVNFGSSVYTLGGAAETARTSLISKWGGITDGGGI